MWRCPSSRINGSHSMGLTFGMGMQIAAMHDHAWNHNLIAAGVSPILPAVWGDNFYNDGAGMNKPQKMAALVFHNMPQNAPEIQPSVQRLLTRVSDGNKTEQSSGAPVGSTPVVEKRYAAYFCYCQ